MIPVAVAPAPNTVSAADYPQDALQRGEEGIVAVTFEVDRAGFPELCRVSQSSGHPSLDRASCRVVIDHFNFKPKPDAVPPFVMTKRIRWQIAEEQREEAREAVASNRDAQMATGWLLFGACSLYLLWGTIRPWRDTENTERRAGETALTRGLASDIPVLAAMLVAVLIMIAVLAL